MTSAGDESNALKGRYRDAYAGADAIVGWGNLVKTFGIVAGVVIVLLGVVAAGNFGPAVFILFLVLAVAVGGMFYMFGIMAAAQGQVLLAALDTAVNTSPLLSVEQKGEVIAPRRGSSAPPSAAAGAAPEATGAPPATAACPSCGATVYTTAKICSSCLKPLR